MKLIKRGGTVLVGLERVIERITGHALAAELAQRIFGPVGMTNSTYPDEEELERCLPGSRF